MGLHLTQGGFLGCYMFVRVNLCTGKFDPNTIVMTFVSNSRINVILYPYDFIKNMIKVLFLVL